MAIDEFGKWERGSKHGWKARHRILVAPDGEIEEEHYTERSFDLLMALATIVCIAGWWSQAHLDGALRVIVVLASVLLTLYLTVIAIWSIGTTYLARAIKRGLNRSKR